MSVGFPTNTVIMIVVMMIAAAAGTWIILAQALNQVSKVRSVRRGWRWGAAAVLIGWLLLRVVFAIVPPGNTVLGVPYVVGFLGFGLLVGIVPLLVSPFFRQVVRSMPETWLVGLQAIRIGGVAFLALADMKLLPTAFALPAGYGDFTAGALALVAAYLLAKKNPCARTFTIGWNVLGLLDFVIALITGSLTLGPFAVQLLASGVSPLYLNYVLIIPAFGAPLFTLLHVYSLFQMLSPRRATEPENSAEMPPTPIYATR